jgi:hypothetical protein
VSWKITAQKLPDAFAEKNDGFGRNRFAKANHRYRHGNTSGHDAGGF